MVWASPGPSRVISGGGGGLDIALAKGCRSGVKEGCACPAGTNKDPYNNINNNQVQHTDDPLKRMRQDVVAPLVAHQRAVSLLLAPPSPPATSTTPSAQQPNCMSLPPVFVQ